MSGETQAPCFYCGRDVLPAEAVLGVEVVAHRECIHAELDSLNPNWRSQIDGSPEQHATRAAGARHAASFRKGRR